MQLQLSATLSHELADASELSYQDYLVLAALTDRPDGRMRAFELAHEIGWEKSRLSHHVSRMIDRSLVRRERCPSDQRGAFIAVTPEGRAAIETAAPVHVEGVRRHFLDHVSRSELATLARLTKRVRAALDESSGCSPPEPAGD